MATVRRARSNSPRVLLRSELLKEVEREKAECLAKHRPTQTVSDNVFAGMKINVEDLHSELTYDQASESGKSRKDLKREEQHLPKKEKRRLRHERFLNRMQQLNEERNYKFPTVNLVSDEDEDPIMSTRDALLKIKRERRAEMRKREREKSRNQLKMRNRQREHSDDVSHFRKVLKHAAHISDLAQAITDLVREKTYSVRPDLL